MKKALWVTLALVVVAVPLAAATEVRRMHERIAVEPGEDLRIEFKVGELRIRGAEVDEVLVDLRVRCKWPATSRCESAAERIGLVFEKSARGTLLRVEGNSKWRSRRVTVEGEVVVPRTSRLAVDMGIGQLEIEDLDRDLTVDMGIGEASLHLPEERVGRVRLDAGIGEAALDARDARSRRPFLVGSEVSWDGGRGDSEVYVDLGIGEIAVHLH